MHTSIYKMYAVSTTLVHFFNLGFLFRLDQIFIEYIYIFSVKLTCNEILQDKLLSLTENEDNFTIVYVVIPSFPPGPFLLLSSDDRSQKILTPTPLLL